MQFSDTSNYNGLIQAAESTLFGADDGYGQISGNTTRLKTFTRYINRALDECTREILRSDARWEFDDSTYTTYPIATADLVASQQDYPLSVSHLKITRVEAKDANGNYQKLIPIDQSQIGEGLVEFESTDGMPKYYDKLANSVFLYPAPAAASVTTTAGLKVYYQREPNYYAYSDTTKESGLPEIFDGLLKDIACRMYALDNSMYEKADRLVGEIDKGYQQMTDFFNRREKDDKPVMRARRMITK